MVCVCVFPSISTQTPALGCIPSGANSVSVSCAGQAYYSAYTGSTNCSGTSASGTTNSDSGSCVTLTVGANSYNISCPAQYAALYMGTPGCDGAPAGDAVADACVPFAAAGVSGFLNATCAPDGSGNGNLSVFLGAADCSGTPTVSFASIAAADGSATCTPIGVGASVLGHFSLYCLPVGPTVVADTPATNHKAAKIVGGVIGAVGGTSFLVLLALLCSPNAKKGTGRSSTVSAVGSPKQLDSIEMRQKKPLVADAEA